MTTLNTCQPIDFTTKQVQKHIDQWGEVIVEPKYDGVQVNILIDPLGNVSILSRAGKEFPLFNGDNLKSLKQMLSLYVKSGFNLYPRDGVWLQGELIAPNLKAAEVSGLLRRKDIPEGLPMFTVMLFAAIPMLKAVDDPKAPIQILRTMQNQRARLVVNGMQEVYKLNNLKADDPVTVLFDVVKQEPAAVIDENDAVVNGLTLPSVMGIHQKNMDKGLEGSVVWAPDAVWHRGKKVGGYKIKPKDNADGVVVGFIEGQAESTKGKYVGFQVLLEESEHVTKADGLTDALIDDINADPEKYMGAAVSVSYMEKFDSGALRHPKFAGFRGISSLQVKE